VVTSTIAWEGDPAYGGRPGLWREYEGGYEDWKRQRERARVLASSPQPARPVAPGAAGALPAVEPRLEAVASAPSPSAPPRKLSYKEQRELEALPARIEALEAEQRTIDAELADGLLFARHPQRGAELSARHARIEDELMHALERWEALAAR
jgi:ATP-binding cassette subfamily F protein uup